MYKKVLLFFSMMIFIASFPIFTNAEEDQPFSIKPILPSNQDRVISNYISISTNDKSLNQEIEYLITNKTNDEIIVEIEPLNTLTSPNGVFDYSKSKEKPNSVLINEDYSFTDYIDVVDKIVLKSNENKVIKVKVDLPNIEGSILGGIGFRTFKEGEFEEEENVQFRINNEMNAVVGFLVNFPSDKKVNFEIGEAFVDPMPMYYAVRLPITLDVPLLLKDVEFDYEVYFKGKKLFFNKKEIDFAPMTKANFAIPFEHNELIKGKEYLLKGKLGYKDSDGEKKTIYFERSFIFHGDSEDGLFKKLRTPNVKDTSLWYLLLLLIPFIIWMLFRRKYEYVLYSDDSEFVKVIDETHELYEKVKHKKYANNVDEMPYVHFYKKVNEKETFKYIHGKTKKTK